MIAKRNTGHGSGPGVFRWVVERAISWPHPFRRLHWRWEREVAMHEAFLKLGCAMICFRLLDSEFC